MSNYEIHNSNDEWNYFIWDNLEHFNATELVAFIELAGEEHNMEEYVMKWVEVDEEAETVEYDDRVEVYAYEGEGLFITFYKDGE